MATQLAQLLVRGIGLLVDLADLALDIVEAVLLDTRRKVGHRDTSGHANGDATPTQ